MHQYEVKSSADALAYIADCTLATVYKMAMKKSSPKGEFLRQRSIAQEAVNWLRAYAPIESYKNTRCIEVINEYGGSVEAWAKGE